MRGSSSSTYKALELPRAGFAEKEVLKWAFFPQLQFNSRADTAQTQGGFFIQAIETTRIHPPDFENWPYKKGSSNFLSRDTVKYRLSFSSACAFTIGFSWHKTGSGGKSWFCPPISRFLPLCWLWIPTAGQLKPSLNKHKEPSPNRRFLIPGGAAALPDAVTVSNPSLPQPALPKRKNGKWIMEFALIITYQTTTITTVNTIVLVSLWLWLLLKDGRKKFQLYQSHFDSNTAILLWLLIMWKTLVMIYNTVVLIKWSSLYTQSKGIKHLPPC